MNDLSELILTAVANYGAPALGASIFLSALGLPLPASMLIVVCGAFARNGVLNLYTSVGAALLGAVLGDCSGYALGYFGREWVLRRLGNVAAWQKAQAAFDRSGWAAVFFTRFWLTALAAPTNLIAGGIFHFGRFILLDVAGEALWVVLYGGLGYIFGVEYESVVSFLNDFSGLSIGLAALGIGIYFLVRFMRKRAPASS